MIAAFSRLKTSVTAMISGDSSAANSDFDSTVYADAAFTEIFKRCDHPSVRSLKLSCQRFYILLSDPYLWIQRCEKEGKVLPPLSLRRALAELEENEENADCYFDYELMYVRDPYRRNLAPILLSSVEEMVNKKLYKTHEDGYCPYTDSGTKMIVEEPPAGTKHRDDIPRCIATSHQWSRRLVQVDLLKEGVQEWVLDKLRPRIVVSEWVAARFDCSSQYQMHAQLLQTDEHFDARIDLPQRFRKEEKMFLQWNDATWHKVEIVFEDYPVGVRSVAVMSAGKDCQYWAGHYGTKFANLEIRIELPDELRILTAEDFPDGEKMFGNGDTPYLGRPWHNSLRMPLGRPAGLRGRIARFHRM